jgi:valyl-tRNA synthetase
MPFVTEALWPAIPHRASDPELLIVARWPGVGERDAVAEAEVEAIVELVRAVRNARAEANVEAASWLPLDVWIPQRLGGTFEALRPAIERLARARPLTRRLTPEAVRAAAPDGLTVLAGEIEAAVGRGGAGAAPDAALDTARVEKDLAEAEARLAAARERLSNDAFLSRAPRAIVDGARASEAELAETVDRLRERLGRQG